MRNPDQLLTYATKPVSIFQARTPLEHAAICSSVKDPYGKTASTDTILTWPKKQLLTPVGVQNDGLNVADIATARRQVPQIENHFIFEKEPDGYRSVILTLPFLPNSRQILDIIYFEVVNKKTNRLASYEDVLMYLRKAQMDPAFERILSLEPAQLGKPLNRTIILARVLPSVPYLEVA